MVELLGAKDERIAVVGNGVDSAFFDAPAEVEPVGRYGGRYVVVIGGLTRRKGGDLVLRTARELQRVVPDFRVIIAGTGEREFDGPASELPNVICLGFVGTAQLIRLLRGAVAMMFLSRYEGFGMPLAEAMAAGTPVIASRCAALPEVVGEAGLLVDPENSSEVAAAIKMLSDDSAVVVGSVGTWSSARRGLPMGVLRRALADGASEVVKVAFQKHPRPEAV